MSDPLLPLAERAGLDRSVHAAICENEYSSVPIDREVAKAPRRSQIECADRDLLIEIDDLIASDTAVHVGDVANGIGKGHHSAPIRKKDREPGIICPAISSPGSRRPDVGCRARGAR